jgi:hypothetical protein
MIAGAQVDAVSAMTAEIQGILIAEAPAMNREQSFYERYVDLFLHPDIDEAVLKNIVFSPQERVPLAKSRDAFIQQAREMASMISTTMTPSTFVC